MLLFIILLLRLQGMGSPQSGNLLGRSLTFPSTDGLIQVTFIATQRSLYRRIGFINSLIFDLTQCIKFPGPTL